MTKKKRVSKIVDTNVIVVCANMQHGIATNLVYTRVEIGLYMIKSTKPILNSVHKHRLS